MRRISMALLLMVALAASAAAQKSLGDVARAANKGKKPASKVYTNDDLPKDTQISVTGQAPAEEKKADAAAAATVPAEDARKPEDQWKKSIGDAKKAVADLEREINLMEREHRLRGAVYYADAGTRLRDEKKWAEEDRKYQSDLADRQKQLTEAKQKLDDLREQARKAGAPSSALE